MRRCEYCRSPATHTTNVYEVEHILPEAWGGTDAMDNLAFSCSGATPTSRPWSPRLTLLHSFRHRYLTRDCKYGMTISHGLMTAFAPWALLQSGA